MPGLFNQKILNQKIQNYLIENIEEKIDKINVKTSLLNSFDNILTPLIDSNLSSYKVLLFFKCIFSGL